MPEGAHWNKYLIGIDPGIDGTGMSAFDLSAYGTRPRDPSVAAVQALAGSDIVRTLPSAALGDRLFDIAHAVSDFCLLFPPRFIVVEVPGYDGKYYRDRRQKDLNLLYLAIGGVLATCATVHGPAVVYPIPASPEKKAERLEKMRLLMKKAGKQVPRGLKGAIIEDELDAIHVGYRAIIMHLEEWSRVKAETS